MLKEHRVIMPLTVAEYQRGQLYTLAQIAMRESGGGEGVQILRNEPFENIPLFNGQYTAGQYTHKIYHINSKLPFWLRRFCPDGLTRIHEHAWNAHPYCFTELSAPDWDPEKKRLHITFETLHLDNDRGTTSNALGLTQDELRRRKVANIDIAKNKGLSKKDIGHANPRSFRSRRTGRGPLKDRWQKKCQPVMCTYKIERILKCDIGGLFHGAIESRIKKLHQKMFTLFHRECFCSIDNWIGMTLPQIRQMEERVRRELEEVRRRGNPRGMLGPDIA